VPTDTYKIQTEYRYLSHSDKVTVSDSAPGVCTIVPQFGALHLTGNHADETYDLQDTNGQSVESGTLPATLMQLPVDHYLLKATYHQRTFEQSAVVTSGITNDVPLDFLLGAARLESVPSGAEVHRKDGALLGKTPLIVLDLPPQMAELDLTLLGYQTVSVTIPIVADRTNVCRTNLVNIRYQSAMKEAREYQAATNFAGVVRATGEALVAIPDDLEALDMQMAAKSQLSVQRQRADAAQQEAAMKAAAERERLKQLTRPREAFDALCAANPDSQYFEEHEIKSSRTAKELAEVIVKSLAAAPDGFQILENSSPSPKTYVIRASRGHSYSILGGMENTCLIVVGQTKDGETQLLFKVLPYQIAHPDVVSALVNNNSNAQLVLMTPARIKGNDIWIALVEGSVGKVVQRIQSGINSQ
jgi:hypothetical protein